MGDRDSNEAEVIAILEAVRVFFQSFLERLIVERSPPMLFLGFAVISASLESFISISVRKLFNFLIQVESYHVCGHQMV